MTYCFGWKYKNSVYLMGDTACTKPSSPNTERSSFGELHDKVRGEYVEESLLKLINISPTLAIAFAGDVKLAERIALFIKENFSTFNTPRQLLNALNTSLGPFTHTRAVELIIAGSWGSSPELIYWNTVNGMDQRERSFVQIGSLQSYHSEIAPNILSILARGNIPENRMLPILSGVVQSYGVHDNMIEQNVGGLIYGLHIDSNGLHWQQDSNYILYDENIRSLSYISAFVREDVLIVNSSITNDTRCLASSITTPDMQLWFSKWNPHIQEQLRSDRFNYWIFISTKEKNITVVSRESLDSTNKYFSIAADEDTNEAGHYIFGFSPELMTILNQPLVNRDDGSLPFRLNFRNG